MFLSFDVPGHINGTRTVTGRQTQRPISPPIISTKIGKIFHAVWLGGTPATMLRIAQAPGAGVRMPTIKRSVVYQRFVY